MRPNCTRSKTGRELRSCVGRARPDARSNSTMFHRDYTRRPGGLGARESDGDPLSSQEIEFVYPVNDIADELNVW